MPTRKPKRPAPRSPRPDLADEGAGVDLGAVVSAFEGPKAARRAEPEAGDTLAERARARRPPEPEPETKLYGRRAAGYQQLNVAVPPDVKRRLKRYADDHELTMGEVVELLILEHVPET